MDKGGEDARAQNIHVKYERNKGKKQLCGGFRPISVTKSRKGVGQPILIFGDYMCVHFAYYDWRTVGWGRRIGVRLISIVSNALVASASGR